MSVKTNQIASPITQDTGRGPSQSIWADCPLEDIIQSFGGGIGTAGYLVEDDFTLFPNPSSLTGAGVTGKWASWMSANLALTDTNEEGGVIKIAGGTGAANATFTLASLTSPFRMVGGSTAFNFMGKLWFECRVAVAALTTSQFGLFIGLADNTSSTITSGVNTVIAAGGDTMATTKNALGFFLRTSVGNDFGFTWVPAGGTAVMPTSLATLVTTVTGSALAAYAASTDKGKGTGFVKLGFVFDPGQTKPSIPAPANPPTGQVQGSLYRPVLQLFVNGQLASAFLAPVTMQATTFPVNTTFSPVIQYVNVAGSGAQGFLLDWARVAQMASY